MQKQLEFVLVSTQTLQFKFKNGAIVLIICLCHLSLVMPIQVQLIPTVLYIPWLQGTGLSIGKEPVPDAGITHVTWQKREKLEESLLIKALPFKNKTLCSYI